MINNLKLFTQINSINNIRFPETKTIEKTKDIIKLLVIERPLNFSDQIQYAEEKRILK
jgi:hypothetical protein